MSWHQEPDAMAILITWNNNYFYMFLPFSLVGRVLAKIHRDKTNAAIVVPYCTLAVTKKFDIAKQTLCEPPAMQKTPVISNQDNNTTKKILEASLRLSTHCKYNNCIKQWTSYFKNIGHIEVSHVLDFLNGIFDKGHAYSTINSAKCAIATIVYIFLYNSLKKHQLINKYMTGEFNLRRPNPKLSFVWDMDYGCFVQVLWKTR